MEYCNVCQRSIEDPESHVNEEEHKNNLIKLKNMFLNKVYKDERIGIMP